MLPGRTYEITFLNTCGKAALISFLISGCAFTKVPIRPPSASAIGLTGGKGRQIILQTQFADSRPDTTRCGMQKNSLNMVTARAECMFEPAKAISEMIASELRAAGFSVVADKASAKPTALQLDGAVLQLFVEPVIGFWAITLESDLHVKLVATASNGLAVERRFFVKGSQKAWAALPEYFQMSFESASRALARQIVEAILGLMDQHPEIGFDGHLLLQFPSKS